MRRARPSSAPVRSPEPAPAPEPPCPPPRAAAGGGPTRGSERPRKDLVNAFWDKTCGSKLYLVERDESGAVTVRPEPAEHVCFARRDALPEVIERKLRASPRVVSMREDGAHIRIRWKDRWSCLEAAAKGGGFERAGVEFLEADVDPVRRYLTDSEARVARPRRVFLDLEADSRVMGDEKERARMLAWALVDERGEKVASEVLERDEDEAEKWLLVRLWNRLAFFDQVIAWAGDFYDFPYLLARTRRHRLPIDDRRWLWLDQLVLFRRMNLGGGNGDEKASLKLDSVGRSLGVGGKSTIDGDEARLLLAHLALVSLRDGTGPALHDRYAKAFERDSVIAISGGDSWELWEAGGPTRELLLRYCEKDTALCAAIDKKTGFVGILFALCEVARCFPDSKGLWPTNQVEGFMLRLGKERGHRFPTHHYTAEDPEKFKGADVFEPKRLGIVRGVHVCDFERLYPSVALSFNLSIETTRGRLPRTVARPASLVSKATEAPESVAMVPITRVLVAQEPRGMLPTAFDELLALRKANNDLKASLPPGTDAWNDADRKSDAYKRAINAFFGVHGTLASRFFRRDVAESMAQGGVWLINEVMRAAQADSFEPFYGDTDSGFLIGKTDEEMRAFVARCNAELFPRLLREQGASRNFIKLAYEKKLAIAIFLGKKRYAARYEHYKGKAATKDSALEVKGLEFRRGDTSRIARELQLETIEMLLREEILMPEPYVVLLDRHRARVLEGELALSDIVISKRLAKPLGGYARRQKLDGTDASQATHVEVGRVLKERGHDVAKGTKVEYVVTDGAANPAVAIPAEDFTGDFDRYYLWEQLVYPPTMRVLQAAFPTFDWTPWERVRPRVPRKKGRPVSPDQLGFGFDP